MTKDSTTTTIGCGEGEHFLCDDWFDPLEMGFAGAFTTSSRSFSKQRSTPPSGGIDMNALGAAAIPPRALSARATAIGSVV